MHTKTTGSAKRPGLESESKECAVQSSTPTDQHPTAVVPFGRISQTVSRECTEDGRQSDVSWMDDTGGLLDRVIGQPWHTASSTQRSTKKETERQSSDDQLAKVSTPDINYNIVSLCCSPKVPEHIFVDSCRRNITLDQLPHPTRLRKCTKTEKSLPNPGVSDVTRHIQHLRNKRSLCASNSLLERSWRDQRDTEPPSKTHRLQPGLSSVIMSGDDPDHTHAWDSRGYVSDLSTTTDSKLYSTWVHSTNDSMLGNSTNDSMLGNSTNNSMLGNSTNNSMLGNSQLLNDSGINGLITSSQRNRTRPLMCSTPKTCKYPEIPLSRYPESGHTLSQPGSISQLEAALPLGRYTESCHAPSQPGSIPQLEADLPPHFIDMATMWSNTSLQAQISSRHSGESHHFLDRPRRFISDTEPANWMWPSDTQTSLTSTTRSKIIQDQLHQRNIVQHSDQREISSADSSDLRNWLGSQSYGYDASGSSENASGILGLKTHASSHKRLLDNTEE